MQICRLYKKHLWKALDLVWNVFQRCDREDYEELGVRTFEHFISRENMEKMMESGEMVFFGAYEENELIGVIAMRNGFHISLLFVSPEHQRKGVAKRLVRRGVAHCLDENENLLHITVYSSPKGKKAYEAMGFYSLSAEQKKDGMRYTPMRIDVN
nr:GNAT family N-acetyltransferase [Eubacterium sp.]